MATRTIPFNSELHTKLLNMISARVKMAESSHQRKKADWSMAEDNVVAYISETDSDALRRQKKEAGEPKYTTLSIPYTYALVMAAHTYWQSVFLARSPVFQYSGRHGEGEMQVQAVEAMIDYQVQSRIMVPIYLWLYDAAKYGVGIIGAYWDNQVIQYGEIVEQADPTNSAKPPQLLQVSKQVQGYQGNCAYNISPFDFVHDPRVSIGNFQAGEFCYCKRSVSWNDILKMKAQKHYMNTEQLTGAHSSSGGVGTDSTSSLVRPEKDQNLNVNLVGIDGVNHPSRVYTYEFHIELVQKEWGLGESQYPEKWVFTLTQDLTVIIGARPLGAIHGMFPFAVAEPEVEAYASYSRGIPEIMKPIQDTMDWLINTHFFNVRASLNNQFIGDPSRIMMKDVKNSGQPGFFFRLRPEGYGQDVRTMLMQLPVTDVTRAHMADLQQMFGIGEKVLGINDQILGAISGGSDRKTATEVRTSTGFGVTRLKTCAEYMSATSMAPFSQMLLQTSQQYYSAEMKLRIVGDSAALAGPEFVNVSPQSIAGQYDLVPVDGSLPVDRMAQANLWKELLLSFRQMPQLMAEYDVSKLFAYTAQVAGLKNISRFRIQVAPPGMLGAQAQAGNIIPLRPGMGAPPQGGGMAGMPNLSTQMGMNAPGGGMTA